MVQTLKTLKSDELGISIGNLATCHAPPSLLLPALLKPHAGVGTSHGPTKPLIGKVPSGAG
jgi:hypothetical protein